MSDEKDKPIQDKTPVTREMGGSYVPEGGHIPVLVEEDAKDRCQHSKRINQCRYCVVPGQNYCLYHIPLYNPEFRKANKLKKYRLTQHYARIEELAYGDNIKNLNEELGILNQLLETIWNQCHTPWDFQINQHKIESLIDKIARTMQISHKLEAATGQVLDRNTLANFVDRITRVVAENVDDPAKLKAIGLGIAEAFKDAKEQAAAAATKEMVE